MCVYIYIYIIKNVCVYIYLYILKTFFRRIKLKAHFGTTNYTPTILHQLKNKNNSFMPSNIDPTIQTFEMAVKSDIKNHEEKHLPCHNLTKPERIALKQLTQREDLIITRADKGGATVIWGIAEYLREANSQLNKTEFYQELPLDPFIEYQKLIVDSLKELQRNRLIDEETLDILKPTNTKPARFYLLPKIHKKNNPGRPVVSSVNCHTTKLSRFVDHYIQPLATQVKSYIRDTTDFLNKIKNLETLPHNAMLVTLDVRSLYSNIKHNEGLNSLQESLDNRIDKTPPTKVLITLMNHVLTLNNFNFNGRHYLQVKGCAMGTIAAPSYATIYMGHFEEKHIYPEINNDCLFYTRYIDDIFLIYTGGERKLIEFLTKLNTAHDSIKFDFEKSTKSIAFLDTLVYIDDKRQLQTTLYTKPTDTHNYLHFKSAHPKHLIDSLPYSQALRIRRICSQNDELITQSDNLNRLFIAQGYKLSLVEEQINKAITKDRKDTLNLTHKKKTNRIPLITTFNRTLPPITSILHNRWNILQLKPHLKDIFNEPAMLTFRRPINLKELIGSNYIIDNKVIRKRYQRRLTVQFCQPCNTANSLCCKHVPTTNSFKSNVTNVSYNIYHKTNCKSRNIIYLLECTTCALQYVGKSEWPFNLRLNNYRHRIKSTDFDKLLPVEQHFRLQGHDFSANAKFTIIEKIENAPIEKISSILETHEDRWITRLKTLYPNGLNNKLNHR